MKTYISFLFFVLFLCKTSFSQNDNALKLYGNLTFDERIKLKDKNDWIWNENRLSLKSEKRFANNSKFYSEFWLRNLGMPSVINSSNLYNKKIIDPYHFEIREAYVQINSFLFDKLDMVVGRQQIIWGTADKLNPTNNINPFDLEDILDFGRCRGTDAVNLQYYFNNDFSAQGVFIPFFKPANLPIGVFSDVLNPSFDLPQGIVLKNLSDTVLMPKYNISESASAGFKIKGHVKSVDFSLSYLWAYDGIPHITRNTVKLVDFSGGVGINSQLSFARNHIIGVDLATSILGLGFWAEAAMFLPQNDVVMTTDLSAFSAFLPVPALQDSILLNKSKPYVKYVLGSDYNFSDGSYFNVQFLHGFIHERGQNNLNDYIFMRYEKPFFNNKLKLAPIGGGLVIENWEDIKHNYALVYMPELTYKASPNTEVVLSSVFFEGKGSSFFSGLNEFNMFVFKLLHSF